MTPELTSVAPPIKAAAGTLNGAVNAAVKVPTKAGALVAKFS